MLKDSESECENGDADEEYQQPEHNEEGSHGKIQTKIEKKKRLVREISDPIPEVPLYSVCVNALEQLKKEPNAKLFTTSDPRIKAPNLCDTEKSLQNGVYQTTQQFISGVRDIWKSFWDRNSPGSNTHMATTEISTLFEKIAATIPAGTIKAPPPPQQNVVQNNGVAKKEISEINRSQQCVQLSPAKKPTEPAKAEARSVVQSPSMSSPVAKTAPEPSSSPSVLSAKQPITSVPQSKISEQRVPLNIPSAAQTQLHSAVPVSHTNATSQNGFAQPQTMPAVTQSLNTKVTLVQIKAEINKAPQIIAEISRTTSLQQSISSSSVSIAQAPSESLPLTLPPPLSLPLSLPLPSSLPLSLPQTSSALITLTPAPAAKEASIKPSHTFVMMPSITPPAQKSSGIISFTLATTQKEPEQNLSKTFVNETASTPNSSSKHAPDMELAPQKAEEKKMPPISPDVDITYSESGIAT